MANTGTAQWEGGRARQTTRLVLGYNVARWQIEPDIRGRRFVGSGGNRGVLAGV